MARGEAAALSAAGGAPLAHLTRPLESAQRDHGKDGQCLQLAPELPFEVGN